MPNLLQELSSVSITTDTSPSFSSDLTASNLITHLSNRASNNELPINAVDSGLANYKSCFEVTEASISSTGHILKFGIDLGDIYFQHAHLIIQSLYNGYAYDIILDVNKFQNYEIYIGNDSDYNKNKKCPGGPFMQTNDSANKHSYTH